MMDGEQLDDATIRRLQSALGTSPDRVDVQCNDCGYPVALSLWRKHQAWHVGQDVTATIAEIERWLRR